MRLYLLVLMFIFLAQSIYSQINLEVNGEVKLLNATMRYDANHVVVKLTDGTLAIRDLSTLLEYQVLSISNDTIFLSEGGFVKLPQELEDDSTTNELQGISKDGLVVSISNGGGSYQDSINVYTGGSGILIDNNTISAAIPNWYLGKDTLGGIVCYIYKGEDGLDHGLIVSKIDDDGPWQNNNSTKGADSSWDGEFNTGKMSNSPIKNWVSANFSGEWYIPSIDELARLWQNRLHVNKAMFEGGYSLLRYIEHWSSSELNRHSARVFNFGSGGASTLTKGNFGYVRAVRKF